MHDRKRSSQNSCSRQLGETGEFTSLRAGEMGNYPFYELAKITRLGDARLRMGCPH
jgi:hypothetical protein